MSRIPDELKKILGDKTLRDVLKPGDKLEDLSAKELLDRIFESAGAKVDYSKLDPMMLKDLEWTLASDIQVGKYIGDPILGCLYSRSRKEYIEMIRAVAKIHYDKNELKIGNNLNAIAMVLDKDIWSEIG